MSFQPSGISVKPKELRFGLNTFRLIPVDSDRFFGIRFESAGCRNEPIFRFCVQFGIEQDGIKSTQENSKKDSKLLQ